jgi:hypothetical protein
MHGFHIPLTVDHRANVLQLYLGLITDLVGPELASLALWIWTGQRRVLCALACAARTYHPWGRVFCTECHEYPTAPRRIIRPPWSSSVIDLVHINMLCLRHAQQFPTQCTSGGWRAQAQIDIITRSLVHYVHHRRCGCPICRHALQHGLIFE